MSFALEAGESVLDGIRRIALLQLRAHRLGCGLHAEKPGRSADRIGAYWRARECDPG